MDPAGYVVRWSHEAEDVSGEGGWSRWYCNEFDGTEEEPVGANHCEDNPRGLDDDAVASDPPADFYDDLAITLGGPDLLDIVWPDQSIFIEGGNTSSLFLVELRDEPNPRPRWAWAGTATRLYDGTAQLRLATPTTGAKLDGSEFPPAVYTDLPAGVYELRSENQSLLGLVSLTDTANGSIDVYEPAIDPERPILGSDGIDTILWGTDGFARYRYTGAELTTAGGIAVGTTVGTINNVGGFFGGYDPWYGAIGWYIDTRLGGALTADITNPDARVATIEAGAAGLPARMVC
ncbi:MAG: hypothetical protein ACI9C1_001330 [Candidatus Aldehydirespiratoraceae bacterium]|jgi:hypothetical protein